MRRSTFWAFVAPSVVMMVLFIAAPLVNVVWQSVHVTRTVYETVEQEECTPSFSGMTCTTETVQKPVTDADGDIVTKTEFVGLSTYKSLIRPEQVSTALESMNIEAILEIDFWGALRFTLTFTLVTLPFVVGLGLAVALAVDNVTRLIRGPVIFVSLLPFIITPVIGALAIRWLFVADGVLTAGLEALLGQQLALFAHGWTIEVLMHLYRVWHITPFAFVIFYAGLQTVPRDTLESAIIDGASLLQRLRYVIIPHLMPLILFVAIIHLMDAYRVFEEVVGLRTEAHRISLQWLTFDFLSPDDAGNRAISRAAATSVLTMIGIFILLIPLLRRTWVEHRGRKA